MLFFIGGLLLFAALSVIAYTLREDKKTLYFLPIVAIFFTGSIAWYWGNGLVWPAFSWQEAKKKEQINDFLKAVKTPKQMVLLLKQRLRENPQSARGWYLLGRLYASQGQWGLASKAFTTAHRLKPVDNNININYIQSLWQLHQGFTAKSRRLLERLLQSAPDQPDALALAAMNALQDQDYSLAISYWRHLLGMLPIDSKEAVMIKKAIAKAKLNLAKQGEHS